MVPGRRINATAPVADHHGWKANNMLKQESAMELRLCAEFILVRQIELWIVRHAKIVNVVSDLVVLSE